MRKVLLSFLILYLCACNLKAQSINDTANYPYWINMMQDNSVNFYQTQRAFNTYWQNRNIDKGSGWKVFKRWEWLAERLIDSVGNFPVYEMQFQDMLNRIKQDDDFWNLAYPGLGPGSAACKTQGDWKSIGPTVIPG
ncbi:MAG: hypothetical protein IT245_07240, partial [Bacteroidia bacterium]|nr:hypothetical protein [Bacteroidia bacterium]